MTGWQTCFCSVPGEGCRPAASLLRSLWWPHVWTAGRPLPPPYLHRTKTRRPSCSKQPVSRTVESSSQQQPSPPATERRCGPGPTLQRHAIEPWRPSGHVVRQQQAGSIRHCVAPSSQVRPARGGDRTEVGSRVSLCSLPSTTFETARVPALVDRVAPDARLPTHQGSPRPASSLLHRLPHATPTLARTHPPHGRRLVGSSSAPS